MLNPVSIPLIFVVGIILSLFLKKSRNLTVLLLFLAFLFSGIIPLIGFWNFFFHHSSPVTGQFFGIVIPSLIFDGHRFLLLGMVNLAGFSSIFFLLNFFQSKSIAKLVQYLLFFLSVTLLILSNSLLLSVVSVLVALLSFSGFINQSFGSKESRKWFILFLFAVVLLVIGLLIMVFSKIPLDFSDIPDIANFFFISGFFLLFGFFPLTPPIEKGISTEKSIFLLLFQGVFLSAIFFVFYLLSQSISNTTILNAFAIVGMLTYFSTSFMATGQVSVTKILSYNTAGQYGLMISIIGLSRYLGMDSFYMLAGIFLTHFFAKTSILWIVADMAEDKITRWSALRKKTVTLFLFGIFVFALIGFPPFPSFFARWKLLAHLTDYKMYDWIIFYGLAFLLEMYYLLRWVAGISKKEKTPYFIQTSLAGWISAIFGFVFLILASNFSLFYLNNVGDLQLFILALVFLLLLLSFTPPVVQFIFSLGLLFNSYFLMKFPMDDMRLIIIGVITLFAILLLISNLRKHKHQIGLNAIVLLMAWGTIIPIYATKWMTVILWGLLFIAGVFLFVLHKEKLKNKALFFILFAVSGTVITSIGIQATGIEDIVAFPLQNISIIPKILIITGGIILFFIFLFVIISGFSRKDNTTSYFSFRNILAGNIEVLLSSQILFWLIQILLSVGIFGILIFGNFF